MSTYYNPIHDSIMTMAPDRHSYGLMREYKKEDMIDSNETTINANNASNETNANTSATTKGPINSHNLINPPASPGAAKTAVSRSNESADKSEPKKLLSTSSPEGIQVASKITPTRLANLLIRKGPLPIRHITSQLAAEVPSFDLLSLSKQRRLIMAAMEQTDTLNNVVFEKIGWGQWAVRKVDSDYIVTEGTEGSEKAPVAPSSASNNDRMLLINVHDLRNQTNLKLGWSKKQSNRRESITNAKTTLHNLKLPGEKLEKMDDSVAIASDSSDEEDDEEFPDSNMDEALFAFESEDQESKHKRSPPMKFANRVPLKFSPPPGETQARSRRRSSSSNPTNSAINKNSSYRLYFNRSRLNLMDNLDNYIRLSAKNLSILVSSPPTSSLQPIHQALSVSPPFSNNYVHQSAASPESLAPVTGRRKSSFNESHLRLTLSLSLPKSGASQAFSIANLLNKEEGRGNNVANDVRGDHLRVYDNGQHAFSTPSISEQLQEPKQFSDTDEEDWATIGAELLRRQQKYKQGLRRSSHLRSRSFQRNVEMNDEEKSAAFALVDLRSV